MVIYKGEEQEGDTDLRLVDSLVVIAQMLVSDGRLDNGFDDALHNQGGKVRGGKGTIADLQGWGRGVKRRKFQ